MSSDTKSGAIRAEDLFAKPDLYLLEFDGADAQLVPMTRESYRESIFTDRARIVTAGGPAMRLDQGQLVALFESLRLEAQPLRFIFHIAHCGSTLFARAFDEIADCLVYREPYALRQLAVVFDSQIRSPEMREGWDQLLRLVCAMLSRRFRDSQPVVVKANVPVNFVLPQLLGLHPGSKGVLLYSSLRPYLINALKSPARQDWALHVVSEMSPAIREIEALSEVDLPALTPAQAAACLWVAQMTLFLRILGARDGLRTLDSETLLERPFETLRAACQFFELDAGEDELLTVIAGKLFSEHAKSPGVRYDAATRQAELEAQGLEFSDQIAEGAAWAEPFLETLHIPGVLPKALL